MTDDKFKLPGSSYEELAKIIQAYNAAGSPANLSEVGKLAHVHDTIVSRNNGFLLEAGIIAGGKAKTMTELGVKLARALDHNMAEEVSALWREVVDNNDFLSKIVSSVRIRKGLDDSALQSHIAYSAGQKKTAQARAGSGAIIEILKAADLLRDDDGRLVATPVLSESTRSNVSPLETTSNAATAEVRENHMTHSNKKSQEIQIRIDVRIDCKPSELDGLGEKLRDVLKTINEKSSND